MDGVMRRCNTCKEVKPLGEFPRSAGQPEGHGYQCKACKAAATKERRADTPAEVLAEQQKAFRAGIRVDKCAICGEAIEGRGICLDCRDLVEALGGLEGLKRAVRAVRYLEGQ